MRHAIKELKSLGKRTTFLDYTGAALRTSAIASPLIAYVRQDDWASSTAIPALLVLAGHGVRYISRLRRKNMNQEDLI